MSTFGLSSVLFDPNAPGSQDPIYRPLHGGVSPIAPPSRSSRSPQQWDGSNNGVRLDALWGRVEEQRGVIELQTQIIQAQAHQIADLQASVVNIEAYMKSIKPRGDAMESHISDLSKRVAHLETVGNPMHFNEGFVSHQPAPPRPPMYPPSGNGRGRLNNGQQNY